MAFTGSPVVSGSPESLAPGVDFQPRRVALGALFDALETAEDLAQKALDRAVEMQPVTIRSRVPA